MDFGKIESTQKIGKPPIFLLPKNSFISLKFVNRFIFFSVFYPL